MNKQIIYFYVANLCPKIPSSRPAFACYCSTMQSWPLIQRRIQVQVSSNPTGHSLLYSWALWNSTGKAFSPSSQWALESKLTSRILLLKPETPTWSNTASHEGQIHTYCFLKCCHHLPHSAWHSPPPALCLSVLHNTSSIRHFCHLQNTSGLRTPFLYQLKTRLALPQAFPPEVLKALELQLHTASFWHGKQSKTIPVPHIQHFSPSKSKRAKPLSSFSFMRVTVAAWLPWDTDIAQEQAEAFAQAHTATDDKNAVSHEGGIQI